MVLKTVYFAKEFESGYLSQIVSLENSQGKCQQTATRTDAILG